MIEPRCVGDVPLVVWSTATPAPASTSEAAPAEGEETAAAERERKEGKQAPAAAPAPEGPPAGMVKACDHPDYAPFFKLLKVGVPPFVVQAKVSGAGLNPDLIDTPDALISV